MIDTQQPDQVQDNADRNNRIRSKRTWIIVTVVLLILLIIGGIVVGISWWQNWNRIKGCHVFPGDWHCSNTNNAPKHDPKRDIVWCYYKNDRFLSKAQNRLNMYKLANINSNAHLMDLHVSVPSKANVHGSYVHFKADLANAAELYFYPNSGICSSPKTGGSVHQSIRHEICAILQDMHKTWKSDTNDATVAKVH